MTRQEEARQLLARLSELAQDETLSDEDATEMVAGLVGVLERMRDNPAWQRVMAKAGTRSSKWPRWITAQPSPPHDPDTPKPEMPLIMRPLPTGTLILARAGAGTGAVGLVALPAWRWCHWQRMQACGIQLGGNAAASAASRLG
jgi:hypothetical protein